MRLTYIQKHGRLTMLGLCLFFALALLLFVFHSSRITRAQSFADSAFTLLWNKTDLPVVTRSINASWLWGPIPLNSRTELYRQSPGGQRLVQYFDKGRMEINNPDADRNSDSFTTSGLLCSELVTGRIQVGDNQYEQREPAQIPVAGDLNSPTGPTYATFNAVSSLNTGNRAEPKKGAVTDFINRDGEVSSAGNYRDMVHYATYEPKLGHNIPDVFFNWLNNFSTRGTVWQQVTGLPITEPYWATFKIGGVERQVLVQLFERRVLTFNPQNPREWQTELGNIGLHYWTWRYNTGWSSNNITLGWDDEELKFLQLINQYRHAKGLSTLNPSGQLTTIARWMSQDMADKAYFSHKDSIGRDPFQRMSQLGYPANTWRGENLAGGFVGADAVMVGWQNSPEHNANMLNTHYTTIGISRIYNPNSPFHWYWSTEFGSK
ncbi:MAG TPA: CAP domain-containing protein [Chloroflexia bacterium]|nr:CAP domain-containing protein [Chloroflexia bacterium]